MRRLFGLLLITLFAATACCDDASGPDSTVEGSYTLRSIDGTAMPYLFGVDTETGAEVHYFSSELTLFQSGTFREIDTFRFRLGTNSTFETDTISGVWTRSNNNVTLTLTTEDEGPLSLNGVWNGDDQLTFTEVDEEVGTVVYVFRK